MLILDAVVSRPLMLREVVDSLIIEGRLGMRKGVEPGSRIEVVCLQSVVVVDLLIVVVVVVVVAMIVFVVMVVEVVVEAEVVAVGIVVEPIEVGGGKCVVESVWMIVTGVEGISVEAKLILKGVEPFSVDAVGGFVVELF